MRTQSARLGLTLLGVYVCLMASIVHRTTFELGVIPVPWAMLIGLVAAYSIARTVRPWVHLGDTFFALGWAIGLTVPMVGAGGSYLIAQDWLGLSFMFGGLAALMAAVIRSSNDQ